MPSPTRSIIVTRYGRMWARNAANLMKELDRRMLGVYVLHDGSMPVYIGKGRVFSRIWRHSRSRSKSQTWDHYSWFEILDAAHRSEVEALLVRMLPYYLRSLNRTNPRFLAAQRVAQRDEVPQAIRRPSLSPRRTAKRHSRRR